VAKQIGFAIVGTGMIADFHAEAIRLCPQATLLAAYSRSFDACSEFASRHGAHTARSLSELLDNPDIHALCITTPSGAHAESAVPALQKGKAVLCEKPLEVSLEAVDRILAAERQGGGLLAGVFQMRLGRGAVLLKQAIDQGRFGKLSLCSAYIKWWREYSYYTSSLWKGTLRLDGGGALMNQGIHAVDLLQWLAGLPTEVCAFSARRAHEGIEAEDTVAASLRFPSGALGVIEAATSTYPGTDLRIEIMGDRGSAVLINDQITRWDFADTHPADHEVLLQGDGPVIKNGTSDPKKLSLDGHRQLVQDLVDAIQQGRPPAIPGAEARKAVALIRAIYDSALSGRVTRVAH
jgi:predicted dehydrogenase